VFSIAICDLSRVVGPTRRQSARDTLRVREERRSPLVRDHSTRGVSFGAPVRRPERRWCGYLDKLDIVPISERLSSVSNQSAPGPRPWTSLAHRGPGPVSQAPPPPRFHLRPPPWCRDRLLADAAVSRRTWMVGQDLLPAAGSGRPHRDSHPVPIERHNADGDPALPARGGQLSQRPWGQMVRESAALITEDESSERPRGICLTRR